MHIRWIFRFLCLAAGLLLLAAGCEKQTEGLVLQAPFVGRLSLQAEPGVVEAWLTVKVEGLPAGAADLQLVLMRDGAERLRFPAVAETTVVDTGLLPAHSYSYAARLEKDGRTAARSNTVEITTLDTTSHDFQWEVVEFPSPFGSGALYDVAIINENDIWAVGEIYSDSTQPWLPYNAVHWDGSEWELKKIPFYDETGYAWYTPVHSILAFSENDIWFEAGIHWNGEQFISKKIDINFPSHVNKMWGTSSNDFYIVGNNGLIAHYDGVNWRRIESGTELDIYDIWGAFNQSNNELEILCTGSKHLQDPEFRRVIFKLKNNTLTELSSYPIHWTLYSVWFIPEHIYYVVGSGVYRKYSLKEKQWQQVQNATQYYSYRIRGIAINDITVVGGFGEIVHFNGLNWRSYIHQTRISGNYYSLDMMKNLIVAVGNHGRAGALTIGKRK